MFINAFGCLKSFVSFKLKNVEIIKTLCFSYSIYLNYVSTKVYNPFIAY